MTLADRASFVDRPFGMPLECVLELPIPPTVNRVRRQHGPGSRVLQKWAEQAGMSIMAAGGLRKFTRMPGAFEAIIVVDEKARIDLDAAAKYVIDFARRMHLIVNDDKRYLRRLTLEWGKVERGCRLILRSLA